jgi:hypothetical protein
MKITNLSISFTLENHMQLLTQGNIFLDVKEIRQGGTSVKMSKESEYLRHTAINAEKVLVLVATNHMW